MHVGALVLAHPGIDGKPLPVEPADAFGLGGWDLVGGDPPRCDLEGHCCINKSGRGLSVGLS